METLFNEQDNGAAPRRASRIGQASFSRFFPPFRWRPMRAGRPGGFSILLAHGFRVALVCSAPRAVPALPSTWLARGGRREGS